MKIFNDFIVSGPPEIIELLNQVEDNRRTLDKNSRFHIGQKVQVTLDITKLIERFVLVYDRITARIIARDIAGEIVLISSIDMLTDELGVPIICYTIELDDGRIYAMTEDLLKEKV